MARRRRSLSHRILVCIALAIPTVRAQQTYYFTGAVTVQDGGGSGYSPAQQAQCPSGYDQRCDAIGAADYCCPGGNTCSWANAQVVCCPGGQTCTGYSSGDNTYQPTTHVEPAPAPTTVYQEPPPATTVYAAGGGAQSQPAVYQGYCSTYYAQGPDLPTTRQGDCGTVLVIEPGEGVRWVMGTLRVVMTVAVLNLVGGVLFVWR